MPYPPSWTSSGIVLTSVSAWIAIVAHVDGLELSANEPMGHRFGEGVYQLWIRPDGLPAHRFDRVELTTDAY